MKQGLFRILKSVFVFQDIISWVKTKTPPALEHNLGKYDAIKKAFYLTALEQLDGDYLEFGVFTGSSFICAIRSHRQMHGFGKCQTSFYGFDSFQGFGKHAKEDQHPFYLDSIFTINESKVRRWIHKKAKSDPYKIVKGYFDDTLKGKSCADLGIKKIRVMFIDCDMKQPSRLALEYARDGLQEGSIIIMDDFFSYRGSREKGVVGAFSSFLKANPHIHVRDLLTYGSVGKAYIVDKIDNRRNHTRTSTS